LFLQLSAPPLLNDFLRALGTWFTTSVCV